VPCVTPMRGKTDLKFPPFGQKDPCGLPIVTSIGGTNVSAENLCLWHQTLKRGAGAMKAPVVQA
jgi:hypothetical protein